MNTAILLIPIYNGANILKSTLDQLLAFPGRNFDILFLNDGSTDHTQDELVQLVTKKNLSGIGTISFDKNSGKGGVLQKGLLRVSKEYSYVGFTDVDLPYGVTPITKAFQLLKEEPIDFVVGNRMNHDKGTNQYTRYRYAMHRLYRALLPSLLRDIPDTQSGMKCMSMTFAKKAFAKIQTTGWVFDIELLLVAIHQQYRIRQLPVNIRVNHDSRHKSTVSVWSQGFTILHELMRVWIKELQGWYAQ